MAETGHPHGEDHRVLVFPTRQAAESAFEQLVDAGVDAGRASLFTHAHAPETRRSDADDDAIDIGGNTGAGLGATAGIVGGVLAGLGLVAIPGIGPLLAAGPLASAVTGAIAGGAVGGFAGSLVGLGVSQTRAQLAESHLKSGQSLIVIDGQADAQVVQDIVRATGAVEV